MFDRGFAFTPPPVFFGFVLIYKLGLLFFNIQARAKSPRGFWLVTLGFLCLSLFLYYFRPLNQHQHGLL